jgi:hypothetical protein
VSGGDDHTWGARRNPLQGHQFLLREGDQQDLGHMFVKVSPRWPPKLRREDIGGLGSAPAATAALALSGTPRSQQAAPSAWLVKLTQRRLLLLWVQLGPAHQVYSV